VAFMLRRSSQARGCVSLLTLPRDSSSLKRWFDPAEAS
jgi:hypothetical protein